MILQLLYIYDAIFPRSHGGFAEGDVEKGHHAAPLAGEKAGVDGFSSGNKWKLV